MDEGVTVLTLGTFDLLHPGHEHLFARCAAYGRLVVGVNSDRFVRAYKTRIPIQNQLVRIGNVLANEHVSEALLNDGPGVDLIREVRPALIVIGSDWVDRDYLGQLGITRADLEELRCDLLYIARVPGWSTTALREAAAPSHETRIAWCGVPTGDGYRARCSCGWMGEPTPVKAVAMVDANNHKMA